MLTAKRKPLVIRDEIHGDMVFEGLPREVIDHRCFQRLRHIKQLGLAEYVFPCANHTRFQHSLGAAFLARSYFQSLIQSWIEAPFLFDGECEGTRFHGTRTLQRIQAVDGDEVSRNYWLDVVTLAGMLHDIGHGPWSHTFEFLDLTLDFRPLVKELDGAMATYFAGIEGSGRGLHHEDISILYLLHILKEVAPQHWRRYFLPIATLVNRKLTTGPEKPAFEKELAQLLKEASLAGGVDFHTLLRPIISGPFDVDRIDYIQRDGRNCGVSIGGIEWRRIVTKLLPCLADHVGTSEEPREVVLVSSAKNQHVLDDFSFSLFQMYAQVYLHPKIVGFEEVTRRLLEAQRKQPRAISFEMHQALTDEKFREWLKSAYDIPELDALLLRQAGFHFKVASYPEDPTLEKELEESGFTHVDTGVRSVMKDGVGVFLFGTLKDQGESVDFLKPWAQVSPMARHFQTLHYSPRIWLRPEKPTV